MDIYDMTVLYNKKSRPVTGRDIISRLPPLTLRTPALHLIRASINAGITANSTCSLLSTCNSGVIFICILLVSVSHHHRLSWTFLHKLLSPSQFLWFYLFSRIIQLKMPQCQVVISILEPYNNITFRLHMRHVLTYCISLLAFPNIAESYRYHPGN